MHGQLNAVLSSFHADTIRGHGLTTTTKIRGNRGNFAAATMAAVLLFLMQPAVAWNATGHKATAKLAYGLLTPEQQEQASRILTAHPRYKEDFRDAMPDDIVSGTRQEQALWAFQQASIWPDIVGGLDDDNRARFHHFRWHFINMPIYLEPSDEEELAARLDHNMSTEFSPPLRQNLNVMQALKGNLMLWGDDDVSDAEKAVALCWILHLVGDMHQPLHNVALFSRAYFPKGDRGGNSIIVQWEDEQINLHTVWDNRPNDFEDLVPGDLTKDILAMDNVSIGSINFWAKRHHQLASTHVYTDEVREQLIAGLANQELPAINLSDFYLSNATLIAKSQVILAGHRIARLVGQSL